MNFRRVRELEAELEAQLEQAEMKTKELKAMSNRLQMENEQLRKHQVGAVQ